MKKKKNIKIGSLEELQSLMPVIVPQVNANAQLALAAAANPLLALEKLGYEFTTQAKKEIEPYVRFGPDGLKRLADIEEKWKKAVGVQALPTDPSMALKIFEVKDLGIATGDKTKEKYVVQPKPTDKALNAAIDLVFSSKKITEADEKKTLGMLEGIHTGLSVLYEYRKLLRQKPAFADKEQFERLLSGDQKTPFTSLEFLLNPVGQRKQAISSKK
ncbi:MAG: hypothetical protein WA004_21135 [Saprospiraceae bacterium]